MLHSRITARRVIADGVEFDVVAREPIHRHAKELRHLHKRDLGVTLTHLGFTDVAVARCGIVLQQPR